jgi:predicted MFS family arabinose efflux permease
MRASVFAAAVVTVLLPWPNRGFLLAALVVVGGIAFGSFWTPAMSLLADEAEQRGLEYAYMFALINLAWAPGQALGASGAGAVAEVASDAVPYLVLAGTCLLTFALLWRSRSSW